MGSRRTCGIGTSRSTSKTTRVCRQVGWLTLVASLLFVGSACLPLYFYPPELPTPETSSGRRLRETRDRDSEEQTLELDDDAYR